VQGRDVGLLQHPRTWEAQFKSGIQTIAVVAVQEGVLQLGSTKKVMQWVVFSCAVNYFVTIVLRTTGSLQRYCRTCINDMLIMFLRVAINY